MLIQKEIGIFTSYPSKKQLNTALTNMAIEFVLKIKMEHIILAVVLQPEGWFVLQHQVTDSKVSKRSGVVLLDNRFKNW